MITDGADFGSFLAKVDMAAVGADPNFLFASLKDLAFLQVGQQLAVSLLMLLLDLAYGLKQERNLVKALFFGGFSKACIHVSPLVVFALSGIQQVDVGGGNASIVEELKPNLKISAIWFRPSFLAADA